jgi:HAE1 family hydrophobic/amphiphilic exporter-1
MLIATILGVLVVPGLFIMIEKIGSKKKEIKEVENNIESNISSHE